MTRISSIYHRANPDPPEGAEAQRRNREAFAAAWRQRGLLVIYPEDIADDWHRQAAINIANEAYGQRGQ